MRMRAPTGVRRILHIRMPAGCVRVRASIVQLYSSVFLSRRINLCAHRFIAMCRAQFEMRVRVKARVELIVFVSVWHVFAPFDTPGFTLRWAADCAD